MNSDENTKKNDSLSLKYGDMTVGDYTRQPEKIQQLLRENFPYRHSLGDGQLLEVRKNGKCLATFNADLTYLKT